MCLFGGGMKTDSRPTPEEEFKVARITASAWEDDQFSKAA
jgi:hypothetical protein